MIPVFSARFGGPVTVVRSISKELSKRHEVTVYTTSALDQRHDFKNSPFKTEANGYSIVYFPRVSISGRFDVSPAMARALQETLSHFDVVHLHSWRHFQDIIVHHYAKKYDVPYVLQAHGSISRGVAKHRVKWIYDASFGRRLLRDASRVIALSDLEAEQYRNVGVPTEKIVVVPNGIDLSEYADLPPKGSFKKKFGIDKDEKIVLYFGRIHRTKGIDFLIKAYAQLIKNLKSKHELLVIAGPDDGYLTEAKSLVSALGIFDRVLFAGSLTKCEKVSAFIDSSLVISPERYNVFLLVPLEAAACGKPVIVSSANYISHMVREGGLGFSVKYDDVCELAETMRKVLNDNDILREIGQKARKFVFENCDWTNIVVKLEGVYQEITAPKVLSGLEHAC